jgi:hypothetical protein
MKMEMIKENTKKNLLKREFRIQEGKLVATVRGGAGIGYI